MKTSISKFIFVTVFCFIFNNCNISLAQSLWQKGGNNSMPSGSYPTFGTDNTYNSPLYIITHGVIRAEFTNGGPLTNGTWPGDGLRIYDPTYLTLGGAGHLDLWTSYSQTTHIKWDGSGLIEGQNNRFEINGNYNGIWLNARQTYLSGYGYSKPRIIFNITPLYGGLTYETGRFGNNQFCRIGLNSTFLDASRRLEVFDSLPAPQFRISQRANAKYSDFQTTSKGDLAIMTYNSTLTSKTRFVGIQTTSPNNTLDIQATPSSPYWPNCSGLRLSSLPDTVPPNLPNGVALSVDSVGNVILVADKSLGADCNAPPAASLLLNNWRVDLNNKNLFFAGNNSGSGANSILVGNNCGTSPQGKVDIYQESGSPASTGLWVANNDVSPNIFQGVTGIHAVIANTLSTGSQCAGIFESHGQGFNTGLSGGADGLATIVNTINTGGSFFARKGFRNIGVYGDANGGNYGTGYPTNYGGYFHSNNGINNYGVHGIANGSGFFKPINYGGHFEAYNGSSDYAIWARVIGDTTTHDWVAWLEGDIWHSGGVYGPSDSTLKTGLSPIHNAYSLLKQLTPYTYKFRQDIDDITLPSVKQYGFCAQQVKTVFPELVKPTFVPATLDSNGNVIYPERQFLSLNIEQLIPVIVSAMFEQDHKIDSVGREATTRSHKLDTLINIGYLYASDYRWNTNLSPITNALDKVNLLKGVNYYWNMPNCTAAMNVNSKPQIGLIAQDVENVVPEVVYTDSNNYKYVDYAKLVPLLIQGIKELTARLEALENPPQFNNRNMNTGQGEDTHKQDVALANDVVVLDQNNPNPFKESTTIKYYIPEYINFAQILFTDATGRIIKTIDINEPGNGQLNVMAEKLSSGIYNYSIVVDGKIVDSKKMICTK
jgi:hypothetical protein